MSDVQLAFTLRHVVFLIDRWAWPVCFDDINRLSSKVQLNHNTVTLCPCDTLKSTRENRKLTNDTLASSDSVIIRCRSTSSLYPMVAPLLSPEVIVTTPVTYKVPLISSLNVQLLSAVNTMTS